jgi:1-deoxy-D-xylulose-5-phosphate synthase
VGLINARFAKPLDQRTIVENARGKKLVVTLEESALPGGFGSAVIEALVEAGLQDAEVRAVPVRRIGLPGDRFVDHGSVTDLRRTLRLDTAGILEQVQETLAELRLEAPPRAPSLGARTA